MVFEETGSGKNVKVNMVEGGMENSPITLNLKGFTEEDTETDITINYFLKLEVESGMCKVEMRGIQVELAHEGQG